MATADLKTNQIESIVNSKSIPSLPAVAIQLVKLCGDDSVEVDELAQTLSLDPALSGKVLKLANSPKYCRRVPVANLKRACIALGLRTLKIMSLSFSLTSVTRINRAESKFDFEAYWFHSICKAVVGRDLARLVKQPFQDEAFFCGLVGRIGQLFMANGNPTLYNDIVIACEGRLPSAENERTILGFDFHDVGAGVLTKWGLPDDLIATVKDWSNENSKLELSRIVHLADLIATVICCDSKGAACSVLYEKATRMFGLTTAEVDEFIGTLKEEVETLANILEVDVPTDIDYTEVLDEARQQMIELTLESRLEVEDLRNRESSLRIQAQELRRAAQLDALTGIPNRGEFDRRIDEMLESRRQGNGSANLAVLMVDVDHFKKFNDTHGHLAGDKVLKSVATCIRETLRPTDFVARYGGEEFGIILSNVTEADATSASERVRKALQDMDVEFEDKRLKVTASFGIAVADANWDSLTPERLIKSADECLYKSKEAGRNCATSCTLPIE